MQKLKNYLEQLNQKQQLGWIEYLIAFVIIAITFFYGFASYALENMNEGLYAEIPREMIVMGSYIIPHLNFVPYLEKPPLLYWLIALNYHLFGVNVFSARLVPILAATIVCISILAFTRALKFSKSGWFAAIILATNVGFVLIAHVIIFDMLLTALFTLALLFFYLWYEKERRWYLWLSYAFLGFAFMTKGLLSIALIPIIAVGFMLWNKTPWHKIFRLFDWVGILILLLTTVPWVILANLQQPGFAWDFFINEQFMRFLNKRVPHDYHNGPFYYYFESLFVFILPWTFTLPLLFKRKINIEPKEAQLQRFLWLWFLIPFIFFSISAAKAGYYIVIGIPGLALLLGMKINQLCRDNQGQYLLRIFSILAIVNIATLTLVIISLYNPNFMPFITNTLALPNALRPALLTVALFTTIYSLIGLLLAYRWCNKPVFSFLLISGFILFWIYFLIADKQYLQPERSAVLIGEYIKVHDNKRPLYLYRDYEEISTILFYTKRRIPIIDTVSRDLYYGSHTPEAKGWFLTNQDFRNQANSQPVYIVMQSWRIPEFKMVMAPQPYCLAFQSEDTVLLSNRKADCVNK